MIPALLARKYDAIVASMSITEERKKRVDFTAKYYNTPAMFVVAEGSGLDISPAGLAGRAVGVQRGTTHQCFMEKIYPGRGPAALPDPGGGLSRPRGGAARCPVLGFASGRRRLSRDGRGQGLRVRRRRAVRPGVPRRGRRHRGTKGRGGASRGPRRGDRGHPRGRHLQGDQRHVTSTSTCTATDRPAMDQAPRVSRVPPFRGPAASPAPGPALRAAAGGEPVRRWTR